MSTDGSRRKTTQTPALGPWEAAAPKWTSGVSFTLPCEGFPRQFVPVLIHPVPRAESNAHSQAVTPHPCDLAEYHVCEDTTCGGTYSDDRFAGDCDANGCDFNAYRMGVQDFYGAGKTVDTTKEFT